MAYQLRNKLATAKLAAGLITFIIVLSAVLAPLAGAATVDATAVTVTPGNPITVTAGQTTTVAFQISIAATGKLDSRITTSNPASTRVQTQYYLTGGAASSNTWSSPIQFYDAGSTVAMSSNLITASLTVDSTTPAGEYQVDIIVDSPTNPVLSPKANANQLLTVPSNPAKILVHVVEPAAPQVTADTTSPTITAPANIVFEGNTLGGANIPASLALGTPTVSDNQDPAPIVTNDFTGGYVALGQSLTITWTATDASGNSASATQTITVVDTTPPAITAPATAAVTVNAPKTVVTASAYDIVWGTSQVTSNAPTNFQPGTTTVTWTATDGSGNTATATTTVSATYNFIGFLSPLKNDGSASAKAGSTIPIKFQLTDYYGNYYTTATATSITYAKVTGTTLGAPVAALAQGSTGFRYDTVSNQYIYNWGTLKGVTGLYQLKVVLDDGSVHTVNVTLK